MFMIEETNALEVFHKSAERTNSLISAMNKIKVYNNLYQMRLSKENLQDAKIVSKVQGEELTKIEQSCGEHAIISLATAFETFWKEFLQQLLFEYPDFFLAQRTTYSVQVGKLIRDKTLFSYEQIEERLKLRNRHDYYKLFNEYSIPLLHPKESEFIEYIYAKRNNFVHNAGKTDQKVKAKIMNISAPVGNTVISTESKKLFTKFKKLVKSVNKSAIEYIKKQALSHREHTAS